MTYRIKDWSKHFENHKSRILESCAWVSMPNKQHGMGFSRVMAEPDGAAIYGLWTCIAAACSQQRAPRKGFLTDDGKEDGNPWTADDIALKFHRPVAEVQRMLTVMSSQRVGWLEVSAAAKAPDERRVNAGQPPDERQPVVVAAPPERPAIASDPRTGQDGKGDIKKKIFEIPTIEAIRLLAQKAGIPESEADKFWFFYDSKGWKVGREKMKKVNSAFGGWASRYKASSQSNTSQPGRSALEEYAELNRRGE